MATTDDEVTRLLEAWNQGDPEALEHLMPLVFEDLRASARRCFAREGADHTLQPTALVNEVYVRLNGKGSLRQIQWEDRRHFFRFAARMMRRLLMDHARQRQAAKRGGDAVKVPLPEEIPLPVRHTPEELLALGEALDRLRELEARQAEVVELRGFVGLKNHEIAKTLGIGLTTVKADWRSARAWLVRELRGTEPP